MGGDPRGVDLFLVRRSPHLAYHPGQIALPGGGIEAGESIVAAAVREAEEEIGVPTDQVDVAGQLGEVLVPVSNNIVTPVLGWCEGPELLDHIDEFEVLETLRVSVESLVAAENRATVTFMGYHSAGFHVSTGWVWGFTGNLLAYLFEQLGWAQPWDERRRHLLTMDEARGRNLIRPGS